MTNPRITTRRALAATRIVLGSVLFASPRTAANAWLGPESGPGSELLFRSIGVRDIVLGAGLWQARPDDRTWSQAGVAADVGDVIGSSIAMRSVGAAKLGPGLALAVAFVVGGILAERPAADRGASPR